MKLYGISGPAQLAMLARKKTGYPLSEEVSIEHMRGKQALKDPTLAHRLAEALGLERANPAGAIGCGVYLRLMDISRASTNAGGSHYEKENYWVV